MNKIVICLNTSWNIYNFRLNLARELKYSGYKVILVSPYDQYSEILNKEFEYYNIFMNNKGTNVIQDLKTIIQFYKLYKKIKPEVVLNFTIKPNIYGNIACQMLHIKTINNISGLGTVFINESMVTKIVKFLYKFALKSSFKVFFQNIDDQTLFLKNRLVKYNKTEVLPGSGVDTNKFMPVESKMKDEKFVFLLIGRMLWDKGIGEYIEAARIIKSKIKNVEFQLLGAIDVINKTAIPKKQMQRWIDEGLVNYLGVTDDVSKYIKNANCVVLPSYREGTPRTLLESASMGKPIITTNVPGCKDVVNDNKTGYLCRVKDSLDLATKMENMLNLTQLERNNMGEAAREKIVKEFDEKIVIDKYIHSINALK